MTAAETLHAASAAPTDAGNPTVFHQTLAEWLTFTACELTRRSEVWEQTGQDMDGLAGVLYRWPLAVARAVLAEVTV